MERMKNWIYSMNSREINLEQFFTSSRKKNCCYFINVLLKIEYQVFEDGDVWVLLNSFEKKSCLSLG